MSHSWVYGVIRVTEDLFADTFSLLCVSQCSSWVMYCCRCAAAVWCFGCCEIMVISSAYVIVCVGLCWCWDVMSE